MMKFEITATLSAVPIIIEAPNIDIACSIADNLKPSDFEWGYFEIVDIYEVE